MLVNPPTNPAGKIGRVFFFLGVLVLMVILILQWIIYRQVQSELIESHRSHIQKQAENYAIFIAVERNRLMDEMISLAEQRSLRAGIEKILLSDPGTEWRKGFVQAIETTCRMMTAKNFGFASFAVRDISGERIAGTGANFDPVNYPDIMERIRAHTIISKSGKKFLEKWTIPVRDVNAKPIAYLTTEVSLSKFTDIITQVEHDEEEVNYFLRNKEEEVIWFAGESTVFPELNIEGDQFSTNGNEHNLFHAEVAGTGWIFYIAQSKSNIETKLGAFRLKIVLILVVALVSISFATFIISRRFS